MKRQTAGRSAKPRVCAFCGELLPVLRPMVLIESGDGRLVGPYHFGCAEKLVLANKGRSIAEQLTLGQTFGRFYEPREETLPW